MKTGSTDAALYCLSATAKRDNMQLIAVILGAPTTSDRFDGARALLDYGFATYGLATPSDGDVPVGEAPVLKGMQNTVPLRFAEKPSILLEKAKIPKIESRIAVNENLSAPIKQGDVAGKVSFYVDGTLLAEVPLCAAEDVAPKTFWKVFSELFGKWCASS